MSPYASGFARWPISKPLVGSFGEGLYEVRSSHDVNIYRVFFCIEGSDMVLLHGFMKKTQATPKREVEIARARQAPFGGSHEEAHRFLVRIVPRREGIKNDVELLAQKEILAEQIREAMDRKGVTFSALASSMRTSRTVEDRKS
jgi:hypothetical protein